MIRLEHRPAIFLTVDHEGVEAGHPLKYYF